MIRINTWFGQWEQPSNEECFFPPAAALHDELMEEFKFGVHVDKMSENQLTLYCHLRGVIVQFTEVSPGTEHDMKMLFLATKWYAQATGNCSKSVKEYLNGLPND